MTPSLGPAIQGLTTARTTAEQPAAPGKKDDAGFGKMLDHKAGTEKQPTTEIGRRDPHWRKLASDLAAGKSEDEPTLSGDARTARAGQPAAKSAKDDKATGQDKDAEAEAPSAETGNSPLQDHLPLLIAFHDLRHFSTSAKSVNAGDTAQDPALDDQVLPKAYQPKSIAGQDDLEPLSKPERVSLVEGPLTKLEGQSAGDGASGSSRHDNAITAGQQGESISVDVPGAKPQAASRFKSVADVQSSLRSEPGKQLPSAGRIDVISERSFPAPPQVAISQAALDVIGAVTADGGPHQALATASAAAQLNGPVALPTHVLKIELHPAELGTVTAHLRLSGEQLSIELKPETHEAYRRLSADSESIVKSLRALGFEVDKVTIMQPSIAVPATSRADATASLGAAPGRDQQSFQPGNSGGHGGAGGQQPGQQSARNSHDDAQDYSRTASPSRERAGGDMFI